MLLQREAAVGILEAADDQEQRRQDQEHQREDEERRDADPGRGDVPELERVRPVRARRVLCCRRHRPSMPIARSRGEVAASSTPRPRLDPCRYWTLAPTTVSHCLVMASLAASCSSSVGKTAALVGGGRRQLVQHLLRHLAVLHEVVEPDRVAVALEPAELALVGIEIFHPQLGRVRMRGVGADRLHVDAGDHAGLRAPRPRPAGCPSACRGRPARCSPSG